MPPARTVADAADASLATATATTTRRSYGQTTSALTKTYGEPPPAREVLSLNAEDVDVDNKRARITSKGDDTEWLHLQSASARLLPRVIAGRQTGPLFLAERPPAPARTPATLDVCPVTGRGGCPPMNVPSTCASGTPGGSAAPD